MQLFHQDFRAGVEAIKYQLLRESNKPRKRLNISYSKVILEHFCIFLMSNIEEAVYNRKSEEDFGKIDLTI